MFEVSELVLLKLLPADKNELINTHYCYFCYFFKKHKKKKKSWNHIKTPVDSFLKHQSKRQKENHNYKSLAL